jgi:hypothetical protein
MKTPILFLLGVLAFNLSWSSPTRSQEAANKYVKDTEERTTLGGTAGQGYKEISSPVLETQALSYGDPHVKIIGWEAVVPLSRFISAIQEGVTDQLTVLKLFSAPNIIGRSPKEKEVWVYHWLWSYENEGDPNLTTITMDHPGKKVLRNKTPVSMIVTFNDQNIVESYIIRLLRVKKDVFNEY